MSKDIGQIITDLGGAAFVASKVGVHQTSIEYWIRENRIPAWHWPKIIELSKGKVTAEVLLKASHH